MVRVQDLGLTWKMEFDITIFKMPAYDKEELNIFHLTQNGNDDKDNIIKFSIFRQGSHGKFVFKYWTQTKTMLFSLGTPYHVIIEVFKSRGKNYRIAITVDDDDLDLKIDNLRHIGKGLPKAYKSAKFYCSNPWEKTLPSKVGVVKNFLIPNGAGKKCCKELALVINSSQAKLQKIRVGTYILKGQKNGRSYWKSTDGSSAIWYHPSYKEWMVGSSLYLGTQFRGIFAGLTSVSCPNQNHHRWVFWNGVYWLTDKKQQIHLFCTEDYANVDLNKAAIGKVAIGHKKPFSKYKT